MSDLRELTREIRDQGAAERRNWSPGAKSWPMRTYLWWERKSHKAVARENFCHFWRVVLIWAPLRWLRVPLLVIAGLAVAASLVYLMIMTGTLLGTVLTVVLILAIVAYVSLVYCVGWRLLYDANRVRAVPPDWVEDLPDAALYALVLASSPLLIPTAVFGLTVGAIIGVLYKLGKDYDLYRKGGKWMVAPLFPDAKWFRWVGPWLAAPIALIISSFFYEPALAVTAILGAVIVVLGIVTLIGVGILFIRHTVEERAYQAEVARKEGFLRELFLFHHPGWIDDNDKYDNWKTRLERRLQSMQPWLSLHEFDLSDYERYLPLAHREIVRMRLLAHRGAEIEAKASSPSRWRLLWDRLWTPIGDFFSLVWSIILTRKWKICPWVEIPR